MTPEVVHSSPDLPRLSYGSCDVRTGTAEVEYRRNLEVTLTAKTAFFTLDISIRRRGACARAMTCARMTVLNKLSVRFA